MPDVSLDWYFLTFGDLLLLKLKLIGTVEDGDLFFTLILTVLGSLLTRFGDVF